jgi:hypothetical protein
MKFKIHKFNIEGETVFGIHADTLEKHYDEVMDFIDNQDVHYETVSVTDKDSEENGVLFIPRGSPLKGKTLAIRTRRA